MSNHPPIQQAQSAGPLSSESSELEGQSMSPPAFQLKASAAADPNSGSGIVQRNIMGLHGRTGVRRGRSGAMSEGDIRTIQQRLVDIGLLDADNEGSGWHWGQVADGDETEQAISEFQEANSGEIEDIEAANDAVLALDDANIARLEARGATKSVRVARTRRRSMAASAHHRDGEITADDPTHQLLANAWPRRIGGTLLENEAEAYSFLRRHVEQRGLPFDQLRVNVVGIRGFSGGEANDNAGARLRTNTHNDTFFVLARDENHEPHVREFPGSVDPGGRTGHNTASNPDQDTHSMESDQQLPYWFNTGDRSKLGRVTMTPMTGEGEHGTVVDPRRAQSDPGMDIDPEELSAVTPARRHAHILEQQYGQTNGRQRGDDHTMYDNLRTRYGAESGYRGKRRGIAIHSSNAGDRISADSTGCQIVHGDWYGNFTMTLQRALCWERMRRIEGMSDEQRAALPRGFIPRDGQELVDQGSFIYSLIEGRDLVSNAPPAGG